MELMPNVPDGGWGWVVVAAVALINMTNQSILSVFGLLFGGELRRMEQDTFTAALITNLNSVALNFSGLFIGPAIKSFRPRNVAATGCAFVSFGLFICSYATAAWHFIVGYSFFVGFGLGLISPSTFMAINSYFNAKRGRAVGVSLAGAGLGQVFMPHLVRYCLDNYGFRVALLVLALLSLTGLFGALLLKPYVPNKHNNQQHVKLLIGMAENEKKSQQMRAEFKLLTSNETPIIGITQKGVSKHKKLCNKICQRLIQAMDLQLLRDVVFWNIIIGMALVYTSTINFTMMFPSFLQNSVGLSRPVVASCMSIVAGADIVCRLLLPCITDMLHIPYRVIFLMGTLGLLFARAALAELTDMTGIIAMSILTGITKSATVLNNNLTISGHCHTDKLAGGLGLNMLAKGVVVITVGQFLGWLHDFTDSYILCLHAANFLLLLVVLVWTPEICYRHCQQKKQQHKHAKQFDEVGEIAAPEELAKINVQ